MLFPKSVLGLVLAVVFLGIIGLGMLAEELNIIEGESGPPFLVNFLFWAGLVLSLPTSVLQLDVTGLAGVGLNIAMLYFVGAGIQKLLLRVQS